MLTSTLSLFSASPARIIRSSTPDREASAQKLEAVIANRPSTVGHPPGAPHPPIAGRRSYCSSRALVFGPMEQDTHMRKFINWTVPSVALALSRVHAGGPCTAEPAVDGEPLSPGLKKNCRARSTGGARVWAHSTTRRLPPNGAGRPSCPPSQLPDLRFARSQRWSLSQP
jgi:hypothetical protein